MTNQSTDTLLFESRFSFFYVSQSAADEKTEVETGFYFRVRPDFPVRSERDVLHFYCMLFIFLIIQLHLHLAQVDAGKG